MSNWKLERFGARTTGAVARYWFELPRSDIVITRRGRLSSRPLRLWKRKGWVKRGLHRADIAKGYHYIWLAGRRSKMVDIWVLDGFWRATVVM